MVTRTAPAQRLRRVGRALALTVAVVAVLFGLGTVASPAFATYYPVPVNKIAPVISGTPVVGNTLTVTTGGWVGQPVLFYNFSWSTPIDSHLSTAATYTVQKSDIGQVITARITVQDGNNHSAYKDVSTVPVTASDVVSTTAPKFTGGYVVGDTVSLNPGKFTSGSGALTYTYTWTRTDGVTTTPLKDIGLKHVITTADLGDYLSVTIKAASPTQFTTVTAKTPGVAVPKPPVSSDAKLTSANKGKITGKSAKGVVTISDPGGSKGDGVFVYAYSQPRELGWFALGSDKKFTVNFLGLTQGEHKLVVQDEKGKMLGWIEVVRPQTSGSLSQTANPIYAGVGALLIVGIVVLILVNQRRKRKLRPKRH